MTEQTLFPSPDVKGPFERFYAAWPRHHRKASPGLCKKVWKQQKLDARAEQVMEALEAWKARWLKDQNKYVPAPLVWLRKQRWDCEIEDIAPKRDTTPHPLTREIIAKSDVRYSDPTDQLRATEMKKGTTKAEQLEMVRWAQKRTGRTRIGVFAAYLTRARYEREGRL